MRSLDKKRLVIKASERFAWEPHPENDSFIFKLSKDYEGNEIIVTSGETDHLCKIWNTEDEPKLLGSFKNGKKITCLLPLETTINNTETKGIMFSDKFGEVRFFNLKNLGQEEDNKEETAAD